MYRAGAGGPGSPADQAAPVATGSAVRVVLPCIDDLIAMKEAAGRPKDRDDVQALRALSRLASDAGSGRDGEDNG